MKFGYIPCYSCGRLCGPEEGRMRRIEVESGRSGGSWTMGGRNSNWTNNRGGKGNRKGTGLRYNTGRTYYKKIEVFVCNDCRQAEQEQKVADRKASTLKFAFWCLVILVAIYHEPIFTAIYRF